MEKYKVLVQVIDENDTVICSDETAIEISDDVTMEFDYIAGTPPICEHVGTRPRDRE